MTFAGQNPDFNGLPNEAVVIQRGPDWQEETFRADTLADCLRAALTTSPTNQPTDNTQKAPVEKSEPLPLHPDEAMGWKANRSGIHLPECRFSGERKEAWERGHRARSTWRRGLVPSPPPEAPTDNTGLIEPVAWMYEHWGHRRGSPPNTVLFEKADRVGEGWTETPLIPAAALATKDAEIAAAYEACAKVLEDILGTLTATQQEWLLAMDPYDPPYLPSKIVEAFEAIGIAAPDDEEGGISLTPLGEEVRALLTEGEG